MTGFVRTAGRRVEALHIASTGNEPVLVFLHEGLGSLALWKDVPQELARRTGCAALVYSRYGNGFSEPLHEPRDVTYMHEEAERALPDLLDAFEVRRAVLIGHSDGASIALIAAAQIGARIAGVVAIAPHLFVEDVSVQSIARAREAYEHGGLRERLLPHHEDADRTFYGWNDVWLSSAFRGWDIRDLVARIAVPVLAIQGADDEYGTFAQLGDLRARATRASVDELRLASCGHAPQRDRREETLEAIAAFCARVAGGRLAALDDASTSSA